MILKRLLMTTLGALGVVMLGARADIPVPDQFGGDDLAGCLQPAAAPPGVRPRKNVARDVPLSGTSTASDLIKNLALYSVRTGCADIQIGTGGASIDLSDAVDMAREAYGNLPDTDDDDYQDELNAFNDKYSGEIFGLLAKELSARMDVADDRDDLDDAIDALFTDGAVDLLGAGTTTSVNALYAGLTMDSTEAATEDDVALPYIVSGLTFSRDTNGDGSVNDDDSGGVVANFTGAFDTDRGGSNNTVDFSDSATNIGSLLTLRQTSLDAIADANEALAGNAAGESAYDYTARQIEDVEEFKDIHESRVELLDSAIKTIRNDASTAETLATGKDVDDVVDDYDAALSDVNRELKNAQDARKDQDAAKKNVTGGFRNPVNLLEAVITTADNDLQAANARGDTDSNIKLLTTALNNAKAAKKTYDEAVADSANPASALLKALVAQDDTGQALVDAIDSNYGTAKQAADDASAAKSTADSVADSVSGLTGEGGAVDMNTKAIVGLDGRVTVNEGAIATNAANIMTNADNIVTLGGRVDTNAADIMANSGRIDTNAAAIGANTGAIADNANAIGSNSAAIQRNSGMIGELSESLETVRAGVAASMALAGMPAINGRGISIGVGSFDGESAFAVGFMVQGEMASFKVGVTSAGGATGASAGVGFQF